MTTEFGTATYKGNEYTLTEQATLTNRLFTGSFSDVEMGDWYMAEYSALAVDANNSPVRITWKFTECKGAEPEDEGDYPWDEKHITEVELQ